MNITDKQQKKALMLHFAGPEVDKIFDMLEDPDTETDYKGAIENLTEFFAPQTNVAYEVYNFRQARQNQGESLDSYHVRLCQLAKTCDFADIDKEIKEHIILSCTSSTLRRRALQEEYSLDKLLKDGRSFEISESQATHLEGRDQAINSVRGRNRSYQARRNHSSREDKTPTQFTKKNFHTYKQSKEPNHTCRNCGGHFPHKQVCPAKDKNCKACGKRGHIFTAKGIKPDPILIRIRRFMS